MADWLDNKKVHPCNFEHASLGAEIMLGMQRSAAQADKFPASCHAADEQALLKAKVNAHPVLVSCEQNRKVGLG